MGRTLFKDGVVKLDAYVRVKPQRQHEDHRDVQPESPDAALHSTRPFSAIAHFSQTHDSEDGTEAVDACGAEHDTNFDIFRDAAAGGQRPSEAPYQQRDEKEQSGKPALSIDALFLHRNDADEQADGR